MGEESDNFIINMDGNFNQGVALLVRVPRVK